MKRLSVLAAGALLAGLVAGAGAAQAAPVAPMAGMTQDGLARSGSVETVAMHRHHRMHRHHSTRHERRMRRMNTMRHGNPNARNPERPGHKQQLGNTTGGPRY